MSKKDDNVLTKKVDGIGHNWMVVEKKSRGKINYYMLECQNHVGAYDVIKESLSSLEHFSGRQIIIPDKTKLYIRKEIRAKGRSGLEEATIKEKYLHHLKDSGKCSEAEVKEMFGDNWEKFKLVDENNEENWEFLFYNKKGLEPETDEVEEIEKPKRTTKSIKK
jgi:hypothetical protein